LHIVADILPFRRPKASHKHKGDTLCRSGHHKWLVDQAQVFDVKQGRLVTRYRCQRCGKTRTEAL
jgi:hypothetical protein